MIWFGVLFLAALMILPVVWILQRRRRLSLRGFAALKARKGWEHVTELTDPSRRMLEAEKVLDDALLALGFNGSFADKLRAAGSRLPHLEAIWSVHKLRNRIAHETGFSPAVAEADRAVQVFQKTLEALMR